MSKITGRFSRIRSTAVLSLFVSACGGGGEVQSISPTGPLGNTPQVRSVSLDATSVTLAAGQTRQLTASVAADAGFTGNLGVTWTSSNPLVATVAGGLVTGVAAGTANITAASIANSSVSAQAVVTVSAAAPDPCAPAPATPGVALQGASQPSCTIAGLGTARVFSYAPPKSAAVSVTISPPQTLAIGLDLDHPAQFQPAVGGSTVTYGVLLPAGAQRLAVLGSGGFAITVDTTQAALLNAQNCAMLAIPGASAAVTLGRTCLTLDLTIAWASGKQITVTAQNATFTPSVQLISLPSGAPVASGSSDQSTHTTTMQLLPGSNQFVRITLNGASANQTNVVNVTVSQ